MSLGVLDLEHVLVDVLTPIMATLLPACLAAWAALKASQAHKEIKSPNGTRTGAQIYSVKNNVESLQSDMKFLEHKVSVIEERQLDIRQRQISSEERSSAELDRNIDKIMKRMDDHDEHDKERFGRVFNALDPKED